VVFEYLCSAAVRDAVTNAPIGGVVVQADGESAVIDAQGGPAPCLQAGFYDSWFSSNQF